MTPNLLDTARVPVTEADGDASRSTNGSTLRILCVDDNEDAADSLGTMLGMAGCEVSVAHNADEALKAAGPFDPHVCILDITMPGMDGYQLARILRSAERGDERLLIALTGVSGYESLERMVDVGFDLYYPKPLPAGTLYAALNDFIERGRP